MTQYTSLELSKKLKENGCELEGSRLIEVDPNSSSMYFCASYDILYDICIEYEIEFFVKWQRITREILYMLQQNKPQEEIEEYIWDNCLFNPKNKEGE